MDKGQAQEVAYDVDTITQRQVAEGNLFRNLIGENNNDCNGCKND